MGLDADLLRDAYLGDLTTLRLLQHRCRFTDRQAAEFCLVAPDTYRRWGRDRSPSPTAVRLLAIRAGYVPWPGWESWEVHAGHLFPPGIARGGLSPGELLALPFRLQLLAEYERQIRAFRALADQAETGQDVPPGLGQIVERP